MRPAARAILTLTRSRAALSCDELERTAFASCAAMLQSLAAPPASPQRSLASTSSSQYSSSAQGSAASPAQPAAAGAASRARARKPRAKAQQLSPGIEDFMAQMLAADLDAPPADEAAQEAAPEQQQQQQQQQPDYPARAGQGAEGAFAGEASETSAAAAVPMLDPAAAKRREKKLKRLLGEEGGRRRDYQAWLETNADGVSVFRAAATATLAQQAGPNYPARQAAAVEQLLVWLFRSKRAGLLQPSESDPSKLLAQLALEDAMAMLMQSLGIRGGHVPGVLERCPSLLQRQPLPETLAVLQELFGGRAALCSAVLRSPNILLMNVDKVKRRLDVLALLLHRSTQGAAQVAAEFPSLLGCSEKQLTDSARFLGTLLPLRPYNTLLKRFPYLLSTPLEGRLRALHRHVASGAPDLAGLDLRLLVSQQPTLLLKRPAEVVAQWHLLCQAAASVPEWQAELATLSAPSSGAHQQAGSGTAVAAVEAEEGRQPSEADQWLADMLASLPGSGGSSGGGSSGGGSFTAPCSSAEAPSSEMAAAESAENGEEEPVWFHRDVAGEAAAAVHGAFGTQQRPWADSDRLRARQLARMLDARRWQLLRLVFLGEKLGPDAARRSLLDVVMEQVPAFEQAHPDFPDWLAQQPRQEEEERLREEEERQRCRAERAAQRLSERAQAAGEAAGGNAASAAGLAAAREAAAAAVDHEPDTEAAAAAAGGAATDEQAGTADVPPGEGAAPQQS